MNNWLDKNFEILLRAILYLSFALIMITYLNTEFNPLSMDFKSILLMGLLSLITALLFYTSNWKNILFIVFTCTLLYFLKSNIDIFLGFSKDILVWLFNSHMIIVSCH